MPVQQGKYPNAYYRLSVKAVIHNSQGEVLSVLEGEDWTLPGGGIDHGEDPLTALKRELYEEALIASDFEAELIGTDSFYVESNDAMAFWLIYRLTMKDENFSFEPGEEADEVTYRNPNDFKDSVSLFEQYIHKYGSL